MPLPDPPWARLKQLITHLIALTIYWPIARLAALAQVAGQPPGRFPPALRTNPLQPLHDAYRRP